MRLSAAQTEVIVHCVRQQFGPDARVMLFGSRLDDTVRGGDLDLLIESDRLKQRQKDKALATCNTRHFDDLSVRVINSWMDGQ